MRLFRFIVYYYKYMFPYYLFLVGIIFTINSYKSREPVFALDPSRIKVIDINCLGRLGITSYLEKSIPIESDVFQTTLYFWNQGLEPIKAEDVLQDITIAIDDSYAYFIDSMGIRTSRSESQIIVNKVDNRRLLIRFKILEMNDGVAISTTYVGSVNANITISGIIEGVDSIKQTSDYVINSEKIIYVFILSISMVLAIIALFDARATFHYYGLYINIFIVIFTDLNFILFFMIAYSNGVFDMIFGNQLIYRLPPLIM